VIAVFTKYDQFKRDIKIMLEDQHRGQETQLDAEVENIFNRHYLANLTGPPPFIRLESEAFDNQRACTVLILLLKECTDLANGVMVFSKSPPGHSVAALLP
jgi:hypothetical protein